MKSKTKLVLIVVVAAVLAGVGVWRLMSSDTASNTPSSPVPADVRAAVSFPVYFPEQNALPAGYTLDETSFTRAEDGVVICSVNQGGNRSVIISEQEQPSSTVIEDFTKQYIPLHTVVNTNLGEVKIGANGQSSNLRTVASVPINDGPWLIITAPADIKEAELKQIIESLRR